MMTVEIVECGCCGAKREYAYLANQKQRSRPCDCSLSRCFVSGKCLQHCPMDHPSCGEGEDPASLRYRPTFAYTYTRTSG